MNITNESIDKVKEIPLSLRPAAYLIPIGSYGDFRPIYLFYINFLFCSNELSIYINAACE